MEIYNFETLVKQIQDMSYPDMIEHCQKRCASLEQLSYGVKGAVRRRELGSAQLAEDIKGILFWLYYGKKPLGLSEDKFQMLYPVCLNLIEKSQIKPEALRVFGN